MENKNSSRQSDEGDEEEKGRNARVQTEFISNGYKEVLNLSSELEKCCLLYMI